MEPKATSIVWIWGVLSFGPESPRIGLWAEAPFDNDKPSESKNMKNSPDLKSMSVDELWSLHELVSATLARKIQAETARLDQRLRQLSLGAGALNGKKMGHARRHYPQVYPKYRNPAKPAETWAGRGKRPRWLAAQLKSGKRIDDFRIN
jgi:DNA-binding protein H-NS